MRRFFQLALAATLVSGIPLAAQLSVPDIPFDSAVDPLKVPDTIPKEAYGRLFMPAKKKMK